MPVKLKPRQIKSILQDFASAAFPDFSFDLYKNGLYIFHHKIKYQDHIVRQSFHIRNTNIPNTPNKPDKSFLECYVASRVNPDLYYNNYFNSGLLNPMYELCTLREPNTLMLRYGECHYYHDRTLQDAKRVASDLFTELTKFGRPFYDKSLQNLNTKSVQDGLAYIKNLQTNPSVLKHDILLELDYLPQNIKFRTVTHPIFTALYQKIAHLQENEQKTKELALGLILLYCRER